MTKNINGKQVLIHVCWWVFIIGNHFIGQYTRNPDYEWYFFDICLYFLSDIFFFYFFVHVTATWLFEKKQIWIGIALFILNAAILYLTEASRMIWGYFANLLDHFPKYYFQVHTLILAFLRDVVQFTGYATVYWFYNYSIKQQKEKTAIEHQKFEAEKEKHEMEVQFLKSQINEHFTYNMLSMFYVRALDFSEDLAADILRLSGLMRFSVTQQQKEMVALDAELEQVQAFIDLNQERFANEILLKWQVSGPTARWQVPHLCLLTLVENAFKHGSLRNEPLEITTNAQEKQLRFTIKNKKSPQKMYESTSIGLPNLRRRLQLLCGEASVLQTTEDGDWFITELTIEKKVVESQKGS